LTISRNANLTHLPGSGIPETWKFDIIFVAAAKTDEECTAVHEELQKRLKEIESTQSASFFGLFSSGLVLQIISSLINAHCVP